MRKFEDVKNLNKKFVVTALGVAALGFQLMQTNDVKADTVKDNANTEQANDQQQTKSAVADSTPIAQDNKVEDTTQNDNVTKTDNDAQSGTDTTGDTDSTKTATDTDDTQADTNSNPILVNSPSDNPNNDNTDVKRSISITASTDNNSATSTSTDDNKNGDIVVSDKAQLAINVKLTNNSKNASSAYWTQIHLPKYTNKNSNLVLSSSIDVQKIKDALPQGAHVTFSVGNNSFSTSDYDSLIKGGNKPSDITFINIDPANIPMESGQSINFSIPLEQLNNSDLKDEKVGVFNGNNYQTYNINISSQDPATIDNNSNTNPGTTTTDPDNAGSSTDTGNTTTDPDNTNSNTDTGNITTDPDNPSNPTTDDQDTKRKADVNVPGLMITNPNDDETKNNYDSPIKISASVTASNGTTTATSLSTDDEKNSSVIVDKDASVTVNYKITNTSDEATSDYGVNFLLPAFTDNNNNIVMSNSTDLSSIIKSLPADANFTLVKNDNSQTLYNQSNLPASGLDLSDVKELMIGPKSEKIAAGQSINISIPLVEKDKTSILKDVGQFEIYVLNPHFRQDALNVAFKDLKSSIKSSDLDGQLHAVTQIKSNVEYVSADKEIQEQMPIYNGGSYLKIDNFGKYGDINSPTAVDADKTDLTANGVLLVDLVNSGIIKTVNADGYSVLLNKDGSQQTSYSYLNNGNVTILPNSDSTGTTTGTTKLSPVSYITLRHVLNTNDNDTKVGQTWTAANNLTSVQDNSDNVLTGNDAISAVKTTIIDPNGILQDGKVTKTGIFEVTYTYNLKDGTPITKTVAITADPISSGSSSSHHSSGSSTSNTSDPVISPDSPDNINDLNQLLSTHPNKGIARLYTLDTTLITNRSLKPATDWFSDKVMSFAGEDYYRVATNEWVKASEVYVYKDNKIVVETKNNQQLVNSEGEVVTNRALLADTAWYSDRIAYINGKTYYRVATNEFVPTDAVTVR